MGRDDRLYSPPLRLTMLLHKLVVQFDAGDLPRRSRLDFTRRPQLYIMASPLTDYSSKSLGITIEVLGTLALRFAAGVQQEVCVVLANGEARHQRGRGTALMRCAREGCQMTNIECNVHGRELRYNSTEAQSYLQLCIF
jgi:hypothetical protein